MDTATSSTQTDSMSIPSIPRPQIYKTRLDRNKYAFFLAQHLHIRTMLNLGSGGQRLLQKLASHAISITDLDIAGDADILVNLEDLKSLPFPSSHFDCVLSLDCLEHLENIHHILSESIRVSSRYVIFSLPIPPYEILSRVVRHKRQPTDLTRGFFSKYYGLPVLYPSDRHKWWFYYEDIDRLSKHYASKYNCSFKIILPKPRLPFLLLKFILPAHIFRNLFTPFAWIILQKNA
jgi:hypothetical protein